MSDPKYVTFPWRFINRGLVARYVADAPPLGTYLDLTGLESRAENSISTRYGSRPLTVDDANRQSVPLIDQNVHTLKRMKGFDNATYRYGGAGTNIYRRVGDSNGIFTQITSPSRATNQGAGQILSGNRFSAEVYRPSGSSQPYLFMADTNVLLKDNGLLTNPQNWGILPPYVPAQTTVSFPSLLLIDNFQAAIGVGYSVSNVSGAVTTDHFSGNVLNAIGSTGLQTVAIGTPILSVLRSSNTATISTTIPHNLTSGAPTSVQGLTGGFTSFNVNAIPITVLNATQFQYTNTGSNVGNTSANAGAIAHCGPAMYKNMTMRFSGANIEVAQVLAVNGNLITAGFSKTHSAGERFEESCVKGTVPALSTGVIQTISIGQQQLDITNGGILGDSDYITISLFTSPVPADVRLIFDVGGSQLQDFATSQDYYYKAIAPHSLEAGITGTATSRDAFYNRIFDRASAGVDVRAFHYRDLLPPDDIHAIGGRPVHMTPGGKWTVVQIKMGEFMKVGRAGQPGYTFANVTGWRLQVRTTTSSSVVEWGAMYAVGGNAPDVTGGSPYDYCYTPYNANTQTEGNPSPVQTSSAFVNPVRQPVLVTMYNNPGDPQTTHLRVYRRGGTLTTGWTYVDQIAVPVLPAKTLVYKDASPDFTIASNPLLEIDNDPPVTVQLRKPINTTTTGSAGPTSASANPQSSTISVASTANMFPNQLLTIGAGAVQENTIVQTVGGGSFTAFLQNPHVAGEPVRGNTRAARPMNLAKVAFERMWMAGDPDNPHLLYYSKAIQPENFSPANYIEIGDPSDPIMALIVHRGVLYVATQTTFYQIIAYGSDVPVAVPTGVKHGLMGSFAWSVSEGAITYLSYDGIYMFEGGYSRYISEPVEWLFQGKSLGPIVPLDTTKRNQVVMTYGNQETFISYVDLNGNRRRLIYHHVYQRFRDDDIPANSLLFELDTGTLLYGKNDGNIYIDRLGDVDFAGYVNGGQAVIPVNFRLQTQQSDQSELDPALKKAFKQYNELTIDCDTANQLVTPILLFDNQQTPLILNTFSTNGRKQVQLNINNGLGYRSQNVGLVLSGNVADPAITFYEAHIRACVEAEFRQSFDSYWLKWGSDEYKVVKQGWFEYSAPDANGVTFSVYVEGDSSKAAYTFTLPQATIRTAKRVRFPALKSKTWRFVATSAADFQLYDESHIEVKAAGGPKGYAKEKLSA